MLVSKPRWLPEAQMSARDLQASSMVKTRDALPGLMIRHKPLPHPRNETSSMLYPSSSRPRSYAMKIDTEIPTSPTSQSSSPRTLKHASKRIGLPDPPPTPPPHSRKSSRGDPGPSKMATSVPVVTIPHTSSPTTPTIQQSPPTPEVTPPRMASRPRLHSRPPTVSDRYASSRTDSFKTARENFYSSDEDEKSTVRPKLSSAERSLEDVPGLHSSSKQQFRNVGLGLGLDYEMDRNPDSPRETQENHLHRDEFDTFDGEWSSVTDSNEVEREWDDNLQRTVTVRKRAGDGVFGRTDSAVAEVLDDNPITPTNATRLLREYPLLESFGNSPLQTTGEITPKARPKSVEKDEFPAYPDYRRVSTMSAKSNSSTVIEAIVLEAPPQRRKTLRHAKKQGALREFSSDQSTQSSIVSSTFSNDQPHRLVHKTSGVFDRRRKHFSASSTSASTVSTKSRKDDLNRESIPVVVIPERRSSMKTSRAPSLRSTSSRRSRRSVPPSSTPISQSSRSNKLGYFDLPKSHSRRFSDAGSSNSQRTMDFPPIIPQRRSSLSAPTSRNASRATSLTAESLTAHNIANVEAYNIKPVPQETLDPKKGDSELLSPRDHNGDPFFGQRNSTHVTPLSFTSHETNGTVHEVSEAQAMAIFPHQNKSILVIDQHAATPPSPVHSIPNSDTTILLPVSASAINGSSPLPTTPPQPVLTVDEADSPLRNPRDPPQPPALKYIPPTPAVTTPATERQRQLGYDIEIPPTPPVELPKPPKRGLSLIRRALQKRHFSESGIARSLSSKRRDAGDENSHIADDIIPPVYPSVADQPEDDSKLHPFWRPARFWDDLEDDDYMEEFTYPPVDNRPGPPKRSLSGSLKRTFAILPIRDETGLPHWTERKTLRRSKSGKLRVVQNRESIDSSRRRSYADGGLRRSVSDSWNQRYDSSFGPTKKPDGWTGIRGIGRRISNKRRDHRNDKLRAMISGPTDAVDGVARVVGTESRRSDIHGTRAAPEVV